MTVVFGFLTLRNFLFRKPVWGVVSSIGLMLGMASVWIDFQRTTNPPAAEVGSQAPSSPWAKDS
jgi:hypothetical protein